MPTILAEECTAAQPPACWYDYDASVTLTIHPGNNDEQQSHDAIPAMPAGISPLATTHLDCALSACACPACIYDDQGVTNGNISDYVATNGAVAAHYEYDPYGNTTAKTGPQADTFTFRFSSKYLDSETGLYYYGYRYYQPSTGRWLSRDPIEEQGGVHLYGFCANNVVNVFDRLGLKVTIKGTPIKRYLDEITMNVTAKTISGGVGVTADLYYTYYAQITVSYLDCCKIIQMTTTYYTKNGSIAPGGTDYGVLLPGGAPMLPLPAPGSYSSLFTFVMKTLGKALGAASAKSSLPSLSVLAGLYLDPSVLISILNDAPNINTITLPGLDFVPCP